MASSEQILSALDTLRYGVYIVSSSFRKTPAGCTCVWVSRMSFDPPLIGVSLSPDRNTLRVIEAGKRFCVNVLGESGLPLARRFGFSVEGESETDKFGGVTYVRSKSGAPLLDTALSFIDCSLHSVIPIGDHVLVLGRIVDAGVKSAEKPLVYDPQTFYGNNKQSGAASHA